MPREALIGSWEEPWPPAEAKPLVIEFWASWCGLCGESLKALGAIAQALQGQIDVIGISIDEDPLSFRDYLSRDHSGVPLLWNRDQSLAAAYKIRQLPSLFIIDQEGVIRGVIHGYRKGDDQVLRDLIRPLL